MIKAFACDAEFLSSLGVPLDVGDLRIWWLGQSGFLLQFGRRRLVFDPYLSDSLTAKYANTDKPHVRMTERVVDAAALTGIDVVTSSHNHTDHLDADTLLPLHAANPEMAFVIPEANREFVARRLGTNVDWPIGVVDGGRVDVAGFTFHGIAAAHNNLDCDEQGRHLYLSYVVRFGPWTIYHSGDTLWYPGLADRLRPYKPDVAFLPINGNKPERRVAGNLDGREAAALAHEIGARLVIPHHYEMFEFNTADPRELFIPECELLGQLYRLLRAGEPLTLKAN